MTRYNWAVIGAGPAGIAAVGRLLDAGIAPGEIAWLDPQFAVGDFGTKWPAVPSNTTVELFLDYLRAARSFRFAEAPESRLHRLDPQSTCPLGVIAEPLRWITEQLGRRVHTYRTIATGLALRERCWAIETEHETVIARNVILAVGAEPKTLPHPGVNRLAIETVLDPAKLRRVDLDGARVAVIGASHSAMIALPNLLDSPVTAVHNIYRSPLRYAVRLADWTLYDDCGLKGEAAAWARQHIDGQLPQRLQRWHTGDPDVERIIGGCDYVVDAVGFARRELPLTPQWGALNYDAGNGILAPGLFGTGIAFPAYRRDPLGRGHYRVGLQKFMQDLTELLPLWLQYST